MNTLNRITQNAITRGDRYVSIVSNGDAADTRVRLSDDTPLGLVQSVTWSLSVGSMASCTITSIASPAEVVALMENTTVKIQLWENPLKTLWVYYIARARRWCKRLFQP